MAVTPVAPKKAIFRNADQEIVPYDGSPVTWRVSAYFVIIQDNQVLIIKNKLEKLYDLIGGGIEIGETLESALAREALEEAGATVKIGRLLQAFVDCFYHRKGAFYQTLQLYYTGELIGQLQSPTEVDITWREFVPVSEIGSTYSLPLVAEKAIALACQ